MMKLLGKPYAGKPHVRFDEGAKGLFIKSSLLYSTGFQRLKLSGQSAVLSFSWQQTFSHKYVVSGTFNFGLQ